MFKISNSILFLFFFCSCQAQTTDHAFDNNNDQKFNNYWYKGKAEISHYTLTQSRYGQLRNGEVIIIYVTEDFLKDKQVKNESGENINSIPILKLNKHTRFVTGIYDYSIMGSTFTPIEISKYPATLKVTSSIQDWCGQSFMQLNNNIKNIDCKSFSYFENEGDQEISLPKTYMEDDVWTRLRMNPQALPLGKIEMIPAATFFRLSHQPIKAYEAKAILSIMVEDSKTGKEFYVYEITYPSLKRSIKIKYDKNFPYQIVEWEENLDTSKKDSNLVTIAKLDKTLLLDYWNKNGLEFESLRKELGIK